MIELGLPFSDPMADGPIIQASSQRALELGMTFDRLLATVKARQAARAARDVQLPNPIIAAGPDALKRAADAASAASCSPIFPWDRIPSARSRVGTGR